MKIFYSFKDGLPELGQTAVAIGNFDGLHLGHQVILKILVEEAQVSGLESFVLTFSPHPEKILGQRAIRMIQTLNQRLAGLRQQGVQATLVAPFNDHFFRLSPEQFIHEILLSLLRSKLVVIGNNFRFARDRQGDPRFLLQAGRQLGFAVKVVPPVVLEGKIISSSLIRHLLEKGMVDEAARYLGRPYEIEGIVVPGDSRGQILGVPTANIDPENEILPAGVFLTESQVESDIYRSVTNIGNRPTFGSSRPTVESHLLGFQGNLYGQRIKTRLIKKIREEKKFQNPTALRQQILLDIEKAHEFWAKISSS